MITAVAFLLLISQTVFAQESFKCPHEYGFYPHHRSCDKYWKCENSAGTLKTCGNGLAFDATDAKFLNENCDYLHNVDCGERTELEPPVGSANCPRLYGIFPDEQRCDTFWSCWNGEANKYLCAPGLAYDKDARVCMWQDQVPECKLTVTDGGFTCPNQSDNPNPGTFSRHAHPEDCRKYYICLEGSPREYGCPIGTVYQVGSDAFSGQCTDPEGVEGCENYYGDELKGIRKSELLLGLSNDNGGASSSASQKPIPRKKVAQKVKAPEASQPIVAQSIQTGSRVQSNTRERQPLRAAPTTTTARTTTTTVPPKSSTGDKNDDYYYYDNYEDTAAPTQAQSQPQAQQ